MIIMTNEIYKDRYKKFFQKYPALLEIAIKNSADKAINELRKDVRRVVPKLWNVRKEQLKDFKVRKSDANGIATATLKDNRTNFKFLSPSPNTPMTGKTTGGVSILLRNTRHRFQHAFTANLGRRGFGVYQRVFHGATGQKVMYVDPKTGTRKQAVKALTTISTPQMSLSELTDIPREVEERANRKFEEEFMKEAEAMIVKMGAK